MNDSTTTDGGPAVSGLREEWITDALRDINERRAVIEQAKGMLMFVYGVDADGAFDVLRKQSQAHNVKLKLLAEQVIKDLVELARQGALQQPGTGSLIETAHERIAHGAVRQLDGASKTGVPMTDLGSASS